MPQLSSSSSLAMVTNKSQSRLPRPRGLWKAARETPQPRLDIPPPPPPKRPSPFDHYNNPAFDDSQRFYSIEHHHDNDDDHIFSDGDCDSDSSTTSLQKRRRISESPPTSEELEDYLNRDREEVIFWDYSRKCSPHPERLSRWSTITKLMDTTSTFGPGNGPTEPSSCDFDDWEDLKELFAKAVELYESELLLAATPGPRLKNLLSRPRAHRNDAIAERSHSRMS